MNYSEGEIKSLLQKLDEIRNLRWEDIDFERKTLHLKTTKGSRDGILSLHPELEKRIALRIYFFGLIFRRFRLTPSPTSCSRNAHSITTIK